MLLHANIRITRHSIERFQQRATNEFLFPSYIKYQIRKAVWVSLATRDFILQNKNVFLIPVGKILNISGISNNTYAIVCYSEYKNEWVVKTIIKNITWGSTGYSR
jgi:hypothetical protein